jgi:hypothetical protein
LSRGTRAWAVGGVVGAVAVALKESKRYLSATSVQCVGSLVVRPRRFAAHTMSHRAHLITMVMTLHSPALCSRPPCNPCSRACALLVIFASMAFSRGTLTISQPSINQVLQKPDRRTQRCSFVACCGWWCSWQACGLWPVPYFGWVQPSFAACAGARWAGGRRGALPSLAPLRDRTLRVSCCLRLACRPKRHHSWVGGGRPDARMGRKRGRLQCMLGGNGWVLEEGCRGSVLWGGVPVRSVAVSD